MRDTTFLDYVQKKNLQRKDIGNIDAQNAEDLFLKETAFTYRNRPKEYDNTHFNPNLVSDAA